MVGRELSKFFIEQMPTAMTQRGQLLYEEELHGTNSEPDVFDNPDAVFQRCCAMMKHAYDPLGEGGAWRVLGGQLHPPEGERDDSARTCDDLP